jgi:hypothetical protein
VKISGRNVGATFSANKLCIYILLSGICRRTKIKNMAHLRVGYCLILNVADFVFYCTKNGIFIFHRMVRNKITKFWAFFSSTKWFGNGIPSTGEFTTERQKEAAPADLLQPRWIGTRGSTYGRVSFLGWFTNRTHVWSRLCTNFSSFYTTLAVREYSLSLCSL